MSKHTPGSLRVVTGYAVGGDCAIVSECDGESHIIAETFCQTSEEVHDTETARGNAYLFAVAHEMLAALRKIREISECPNPSDVELEIIEICDVVAHKAEGKSR